MALDFSPFVDSLKQTVLELAGVKTSYEQLASDGPIPLDIGAGMILNLPLENDKQACVAMTCSRECAVQLGSLILGKKVGPNDAILNDILAEIISIVAGSTQKKSLMKYSVSSPVLIAGKLPRLQGNAPRVAHKFTARLEGHDIGMFLLEAA